MKKLFNYLTQKLRKVNSNGKERVQIRSTSQPDVLQHHLQYSGIKHDQHIEANLRRVRIERTDKEGKSTKTGDLTMFFCPMNRLDVLAKHTDGDTLRLPGEVKLHGLDVPNDLQPGLYDLMNVKVHANGAINVTATENTRLELVGS